MSEESEMSDGPPIISLVPDYGSPWGLWSSHPPFPFSDPGTVEQLGPDNFGFDNEIREALRAWVEAWRCNFADAPYEHRHTWRHGFDVDAWINEGDRISRMIEESLPGYKVERIYRSYAQNATRNTEPPGSW